MSENDVIVPEQPSDADAVDLVEESVADASESVDRESTGGADEAAGARAAGDDAGEAAGARAAGDDAGEAAGARAAGDGAGEAAGARAAGDDAGEAREPEAGRRGSRRSLLEREGEVAADFLETLLDIADLDGDIDLDVDGDRAVVAIVDSEEGRVPRRLVGTNGRVLEALQELTRLAVQSATGERSRLMLDVAGFRAERRAALVAQARSAIEKCRADQAPVELEPMSAFERKVVHDEVLAAGLVSESSGVEPRRYVVVLPAR